MENQTDYRVGNVSGHGRGVLEKCLDGSYNWLVGPGGVHTPKAGLRRLTPVLLLLVMVTVYVLAQVWNFTPGYFEPDPDGYISLAKRMARGETLGAVQKNPFQYHQHLWVETPEGRILPKFAPGVSVLLAVGYALGGDTGVFWVSPVLGGLTLIGAFFLFRLWMSSLFALLGVVTLMVNWYFFFFASYPLTHTADLCATTWGMYGVWAWHRKPRVATGILGGLVLGFAACVRYTGVVFVAVPAVAILASFVRRRGSRSHHWGPILALTAGWLICPVLMALYNYLQFGDPRLTGYAFSDEQTAFGMDYVRQNFLLLNQGLYRDMLPFVFPLGLVGMVLVGNRSDRVMRVAWLLPLYLVYLSYYWAKPNASYYRFLIGLVPLIIGSAFMMVEYVQCSRVAQRIAGLLITAIVVSTATPFIVQISEGDLFRSSEREFADRMELVCATLNPDALILTRHPFCNQLAVRRDFEVYDLKWFTREYGVGEFVDPDVLKTQKTTAQPPRRQPSRTRLFASFYEDATRDLLKHMKRDMVLAALNGGRQVALLLPADQAADEAGAIGPDIRLRRLATWLPTDANAKQLWGKSWALYEVSR